MVVHSSTSNLIRPPERRQQVAPRHRSRSTGPVQGVLRCQFELARSPIGPAKSIGRDLSERASWPRPIAVCRGQACLIGQSPLSGRPPSSSSGWRSTGAASCGSERAQHGFWRRSPARSRRAAARALTPHQRRPPVRQSRLKPAEQRNNAAASAGRPARRSRSIPGVRAERQQNVPSRVKWRRPCQVA